MYFEPHLWFPTILRGRCHDSCCNLSCHPCFYTETLNIGVPHVLWHFAFPSAQTKNLVLFVEDECVTCNTSRSLQEYSFFPGRLPGARESRALLSSLTVGSLSSSLSTVGTQQHLGLLWSPQYIVSCI